MCKSEWLSETDKITQTIICIMTFWKVTYVAPVVYYTLIDSLTIVIEENNIYKYISLTMSPTVNLLKIS